MLTKIGGWEAIALSSLSGNSYHSLTSPENIQNVLVDQPVDQWTFPTTNEGETRKYIAINSNCLFQHLISTNAFYKNISSHDIYISLRRGGADLVQDFVQNPALLESDLH